MQSILKAFALGNLVTETQHIENNPEIFQATQVGSEAEEKLLAGLDDEMKKKVEQYTNAQMRITAVSCTDSFLYGYRLGVLMTMEVFNGKDDLILGGEGE